MTSRNMAAMSSVTLINNVKNYKEKENLNNKEKHFDVKGCFWELPNWNSSVRETAVLNLISSLTNGKVPVSIPCGV